MRKASLASRFQSPISLMQMAGYSVAVIAMQVLLRSLGLTFGLSFSYFVDALMHRFEQFSKFFSELFFKLFSIIFSELFFKLVSIIFSELFFELFFQF